MHKENKTGRAFELDFLRGFAIIMMILHHFIFDLRHILGLDVFAWQDTDFFRFWIRSPFLFVFLFVSGICCSFSRNNFKRALRIFLVGILLSLIFYGVSAFSEEDMYVIFNVVHLLAVGIFLFAVMDKIFRKPLCISHVKYFAAISVLILWLEYPLNRIKFSANIFLSPLHGTFVSGIGMADYLPIVPWLGFFFFGVFFGILYYGEKTTLFPGAPEKLVAALKPVTFVGRYAIYFYVFHQPVLLGVLFLMRYGGII